uniref:Uncharacterized protein n=1 Tax=Octopus bimaculoides TaxID=37653 RepID=A0A0L8IH30_OCTBM
MSQLFSICQNIRLSLHRRRHSIQLSIHIEHFPFFLLSTPFIIFTPCRTKKIQTCIHTVSTYYIYIQTAEYKMNE